MKKQKGSTEAVVVVLLCGAALGVLALLFFGLPIWNVWRAGLSGEAELKRAEQNRQIAVLEAKAKLEAATHLNAAEVERANGLAEANEIVIRSVGGAEPYLRYLWIQAMAEGNGGAVIYIPTEAGLPILEAGKR